MRFEIDTKTMIRVEGKPIVEYIVEAAETAVPETKPVVIVGFQGHTIQAYLGDRVICVEQKEQLGTGHAVACAAPLLRERKDIKYVIVLAGDQPLISADTIRTVLDHHEKSQETITLGTVVVPDYSGIHEHLLHYGRIVRKEDGTVSRIVEYKDATEEERAIREVNTSVYCFDADWLWSHIDMLGSDNASKEFYITDLIGMAMEEAGLRQGSGAARPNINAIPLPDPLEGLNVNTPDQLMAIGGVMGERKTDNPLHLRQAE
jgi:bifunctional UDP-N-acetylglucosamine pyrophosphorylase / glucosamine-1-phosphate N-acetyltransferase